MSRFFGLAVAAAAALASSCTHSASQAGEPVAGASSSLVGTWESTCIHAGGPEYFYLVARYTETGLKTSEVHTNVPDCTSRNRTGPKGESIVNMGGYLKCMNTSYEVVGRDGDTLKVDHRMKAAWMVMLARSMREMANRTKMYGYGDWTPDPKPILGRSREATQPPELPKAGETRFGLVKVTGDVMTLGDIRSGNGLSEATRPNKLSNLTMKRTSRDPAARVAGMSVDCDEKAVLLRPNE